MVSSEKPQSTSSSLGSPASLKAIPLGGLAEIGKNTMALVYGNDMILIDAGLGFPSEDMLGVDIVLPDYSFLKEHQSKIRGIVITHGHEDHIGGIPYILKDIDIPVIYGPALAMGLLEEKLNDVGLQDRTVLRQVKPRQQVKLGCFGVQFIRCTHSIADSYSVIIRTPIGNVFHTGDFKFDFTPVDGELFDFAALTATQKEEGILLLMSDSTNTERAGYTPSERTVWKKLDEVFGAAKNRIIVTTFASNVHRMRQIIQAAIKYERKVAILGRSMLNLAGIARELGYMNFPDGLLLKIEEINQLPRDKVVIMTTGSQGEPLSALTRIAKNEHKQVKIVPGDTVIISATPIPGNERSIANTINELFLRGANVIYGKGAGVHVSGHACREEQKLMINLCKPKFFMPVHGEYRMLVKHAELATECGVLEENTFVMENGDVLELFKDRGAKIGTVKAGITLIDNSTSWPIDLQTVEERQLLAEDGVVNISLTVTQNKEILVGPDISIRGIILPKATSPEEFLEQMKADVLEIFEKEKALKKLSGNDLKSFLIGAINKNFETRMKFQPLVQILIQEVSVKGATTIKESQTQSKQKL
ncbi:MAG: ribonuclease J [Candidatus Obscuribacterales bacterium]|jgi:ribonuclease J|nr:ribonuclease J [Candidatus Obscuribacterales bacterium]